MTEVPETSIDALAPPPRPSAEVRIDVIHLAIRLGLLALLTYWCFVLLQPFLAIMAWSIILAVALYPAYAWIAARIGGRRGIAAAIMTILAFVIVAGPVIWLGAGVVESGRDLMANFGSGTLLIMPPPESIKSWPLVGEYIDEFWRLASTNLKSAIGEVAPYVTGYAGPVLGAVGGAGAGVLKFLAALVIAGFLFAPAPRLVEVSRSFLMRLVPERGDEFISLAAMTIRSVSQGVIGISVVQAVLAGIGLKLIGFPNAGLLAFLIMASGILQIGAAIFLVPAAIWVWITKDTTAALLFTAYMIPVGLMENVLKPIIMGRGLKTPAIVIFIGVIGGTLEHGIVGLFVGPVVLALGWSLLAAWFAGPKELAALAGAESAAGSAAAGDRAIARSGGDATAR